LKRYDGDSLFDLIQVNYVRYRTLIVPFRASAFRHAFAFNSKAGRKTAGSIGRWEDHAPVRPPSGLGTNGQQKRSTVL
jgi:hypothetical protein